MRNGLIGREFLLSASLRLCRVERLVDALSGTWISAAGRDAMLPSGSRRGLSCDKERRETGPTDLVRARLEPIIHPAHPLVRLARAIDGRFLAERFGAVSEDGPGRPCRRGGWQAWPS